MIPAVCFAVLFAGFLAGLAVWVWPDPADFDPYDDDLDTLARHRAAMQALERRETP